MNNGSLTSHVKKLAYRWTLTAMVLTLIVSVSLVGIFSLKDAEREASSMATSIVNSHRTEILSGDIRSIELQLNKDFALKEGEQLIFLDQNKGRWIADLREKVFSLCNKNDGLCRNYSQGKITLEHPIYFDNEKTSLWGYLHVERFARPNIGLILVIFISIFFGMAFQSFGFYFNLLKSVRSVSSTIGSWAKKLSSNPKDESNYEIAPFSEMEPIQDALIGLRNEIDALEQIARSEGALTTLRSIGHDILNPVSRMKRITGLLKMSPNIDKELILNLQMNLKRLSSYAEQLKILYKRKTGENAEPLQLINLSDEIKNLANEYTFDPEAISKNIKFETEIDENVFTTVPSPVVGRVVENLVGNSIHASFENGIIKIIAKRESNDIVLSVEDNGSGIKENLQSKIFEPEFTTKSNKGTGLGLFVVKQMCEEFGGRISVSSKQNEGTIVQIKFPIVEAAI